MPAIDDIIARVLAQAAARRDAMPEAPSRRIPWETLGARLLAGPDAAAEFRQRLQDEARFEPRSSRRYAMGEFTRFHGPAFVDACYRGLLGRAPDADGRRHFMGLLLRGARKPEVMAQMRWSPEGRAFGAHVPGLALHALLAGLVRVPLAGRVFEWVLSLALLPQALRGIRAQEAHDAARHQQLVEEIERALRRVEGEAGRGRR